MFFRSTPGTSASWTWSSSWRAARPASEPFAEPARSAVVWGIADFLLVAANPAPAGQRQSSSVCLRGPRATRTTRFHLIEHTILLDAAPDVVFEAIRDLDELEEE